MSIDVNEFRFVLRKLERELDSQLKSSMDCCGVSFVQCHTLMEIERQKDTNLKALSTSLGLDSSTVSRSIDGLVKSGFVDRTTDPENRRYIRLTLSHKGKQQCASINDFCNDYYEKIFEHIPTDKRDQVAESIGLFVSALDKVRTGISCTDSVCKKK